MVRYTAAYMVPDGSRRLSPQEACVSMRTEKMRLAYERFCPQCKAKAGEVCLKTVTVGWTTTRQIMERPHNERYAVAQRVSRREARAKYTAQHLEYLEREAQASARRAAAAKARWHLMAPMREFDQREARQLAAWLSAYGDVFAVPESGTGCPEIGDTPDQSA